MYLCCDAWHHEGQCLHRTRSSEPTPCISSWGSSMIGLTTSVAVSNSTLWIPLAAQTQIFSNAKQIKQPTKSMKNGWLQPMKMKPYEADHMTSRAFSPAWPLTHAWRSFIDGINWAGAGWQRLANSLLPAKAPLILARKYKVSRLLRSAEEQAGCCLRFKPRHAFSPERSGIEAGVERDTRPAMFRKRREVVRLSIDGKTRSGALKNLLVH